MNQAVAPNFGELLAPFIGAVPEHAVPNFLALLERGAAQRYRDWAEQLPAHAAGLTACSAREDEIADIVEGLFPIESSLQDALQAPLPAARDTYYQVFSGLSLADQLAIQADAELQGAAAWRAMLTEEVPDALRAGLERCSSLEEESSAYLRSILAAGLDT
jgi:hypothetical protein